MKNQKTVFISYSWSNSETKEKVLSLAKMLKSDGINVILDIWHLKPGHDIYYFMESSVLDSNTDNVLVICDKSYAHKANSRSGGVGDETTLITPQIYSKVNQEKFIPVVFEKGADKSEYLPRYLQSRLYIDMSGDGFAENYNYLKSSIIHVEENIAETTYASRFKSLDFSLKRDIKKEFGLSTGFSRISYLTERSLIAASS